MIISKPPPKFREHLINDANNFILGWYSDNSTLCDKIVDYHKTTPTKVGCIGDGIVDEKRKKSQDLQLNDETLLGEYVSMLQECCNLYSSTYPFCNYYAPWRMVEFPNIQKYDPNGAFYAWHTERDSASGPGVARHLVYMTYLNDVSDQGETEFFHQKIKIKPERGLTLIWPVDWTFTHRGIPSPSETKYIVTGWFNFVEKGS